MLTGEHELYAMAKYTLMKNNVSVDDDLLQELVLYALESEKYFDESKGRWDYYIFFAMERRLKQIWSTKYAKKRWNGLIPYSLEHVCRADGKRYIFLYDLIPDDYDFKEEFHKKELINELMKLVEEPLKLWLDGWTYIKIGKKLRCSHTYVQVLVKKNIEKIKDYCERRKIECNIY